MLGTIQFEILKQIKSFYKTLYTDYDTDLIDIDFKKRYNR